MSRRRGRMLCRRPWTLPSRLAVVFHQGRNKKTSTVSRVGVANLLRAPFFRLRKPSPSEELGGPSNARVGPASREIYKRLLSALLSKRVSAALTRSYAHDLLHGQDKDFAVADTSGTSRALDGFDDLGGGVVGDNDFKFDFGQEIDHVLRATVEFRVALLAAESLNLANREALHTDSRQRLFDLVEFERLYDRLNLLHKTPLGGILLGRSGPANHTPQDTPNMTPIVKGPSPQPVLHQIALG